MSTDGKRDFLLSSMRVASLNLKSWATEIDMIGTALRGDQMSIDTACEWLDDMGVLRWLPEPTTEPNRSEVSA